MAVLCARSHPRRRPRVAVLLLGESPHHPPRAEASPHRLPCWAMKWLAADFVCLARSSVLASSRVHAWRCRPACHLAHACESSLGSWAAILTDRMETCGDARVAFGLPSSIRPSAAGMHATHVRACASLFSVTPSLSLSVGIVRVDYSTTHKLLGDMQPRVCGRAMARGKLSWRLPGGVTADPARAWIWGGTSFWSVLCGRAPSH